MSKTPNKLPQFVKQHTLIAVIPTQYEDVTAKIYKWCGTDRTTIIWGRPSPTKRVFVKVCQLDMHYLDLYATVEEMVGDLKYLTQMMADGGWRDADIRGDNKRVFGADFW